MKKTNQFVCWSSMTSRTFFSSKSGLTAERGLLEVSDAKNPELDVELGAKQISKWIYIKFNVK